MFLIPLPICGHRAWSHVLDVAEMGTVSMAGQVSGGPPSYSELGVKEGAGKLPTQRKRR